MTVEDENKIELLANKIRIERELRELAGDLRMFYCLPDYAMQYANRIIILSLELTNIRQQLIDLDN